MLEIRNVTKVFNGIPAVQGINLRIGRGEILGYLGPNGSGKSTTVKIAAGLLKPTRGAVMFHGEDIRKDLAAYKERLGYVPEEPHFYPHMSGLEHLQLMGRLRNMPEPVMNRRLEALLELFGLHPQRNLPLAAYSKGMRQKVLLIGAILHDPEVLILDEPLSGLDVSAMAVVRHLLAELAKAGKVILYSSHVLEIVEKVSTRVSVLYRGRVVADDSVESLRRLMDQPSLEQVFAELVQQESPEQTAREIRSVIERT